VKLLEVDSDGNDGAFAIGQASQEGGRDRDHAIRVACQEARQAGLESTKDRRFPHLIGLRIEIASVVCDDKGAATLQTADYAGEAVMCVDEVVITKTRITVKPPKSASVRSQATRPRRNEYVAMDPGGAQRTYEFRNERRGVWSPLIRPHARQDEDPKRSGPASCHHAPLRGSAKVPAPLRKQAFDHIAYPP
jgi:hypothetical protein